MILETKRLRITSLGVSEADFYFQLFTDKDWVTFISDKKLKTVEETAAYLQTMLIPNFNKNRLGFFTVSLKETGEKIGVSTLIKRDNLSYIDVGYGFLPKGRGKGYATEATQKMIQFVQKDLQQKKVLAITKPNNIKSQNVLKKLGFVFVKLDTFFNEKQDALFEYIF